MPSWLRSYVNYLRGITAWAFHWTVFDLINWAHWVSTTLNGVVMFSYRAYSLLTWDIANFSYYVAKQARANRRWTEWLAYDRIPTFTRRAERYAYAWAQKIRQDAEAANRRLEARLMHVIAVIYGILLSDIKIERADRIKAIADLRAFLLALIAKVYKILLKDIADLRAWTQKQLTDLRNWAQQQFDTLWKYARSILPTVDKEASDGYNSARSDQASGVSKLIDDLATDNPLIHGIVGDLVKLMIQLAEVDDPVIRIAAQILLRQVIDRLGVDKLAGGLADELARIFLGGGKPKTLQDVEAQVASRLNAGEAQWQQFYQNGGNDLETLGDQMRKSASPIFTLAMAGYFAGAVLDPKGTAAVTDAVVTPAARAILTPLLAVLGG